MMYIYIYLSVYYIECLHTTNIDYCDIIIYLNYLVNNLLNIVHLCKDRSKYDYSMLDSMEFVKYPIMSTDRHACLSML